LDNLKIEDLPMPVPEVGEVLVKVFAAAINPSDPKNVLGKMEETRLPRVPGRDFAGRVVAGDSEWDGKLVFGTGGDLGFGRDGSHAEFVTVPVEGLVEMPPELTHEQPAFCPQKLLDSNIEIACLSGKGVAPDGLNHTSSVPA
jgi:NADPH:quinone reductase